MGQHVVKLVEDGTTGMDSGWALVHTPDTGDIVCLIERHRICTAEAAEDMMNEAWPIAADWENAEIEEAVREAHGRAG